MKKSLSFLFSILLTGLTAYSQQEAGPGLLTDERKKVAVLISDGGTLIDYAGPMEVFEMAGMKVYTVAEKPEPVKASLTIIPDHTLENCPEPDIIVIPGGLTSTPAMVNWIRQISHKAAIVLSVCTGASFLAEAGMLDNLEATTYAPHLEHLQHEAPSAKIVSDRRVVDNGKIITSGGLSAGIDGALHVVERMMGKGRANEVAVNMEYNWNPEGSYVRAQLADLQSKMAFVLDEALHPRLKKRTIVYEGDRGQWKFGYEVEAKQSLSDFGNLLVSSLSEWGWSKSAGDLLKSEWEFGGESNRRWSGTMDIIEVPGQTGWIRLTIEVNLQNQQD